LKLCNEEHKQILSINNMLMAMPSNEVSLETKS
jgi:hypothetical protein